MSTVCDIILQLKQKGIKGYSGKNKAQLLAMLATKTKQPEPEIKIKVKKKPKKKTEPEKKTAPLYIKHSVGDKYDDKSYLYLKKLGEKVSNLASSQSATLAERTNAKNKLSEILKAKEIARKKQYAKKKKKKPVFTQIITEI